MDAELLKRVGRGAGFRTEVREDLGLKFIFPDDLAALARAVAEECARIAEVTDPEAGIAIREKFAP